MPPKPLIVSNAEMYTEVLGQSPNFSPGRSSVYLTLQGDNGFSLRVELVHHHDYNRIIRYMDSGRREQEVVCTNPCTCRSGIFFDKCDDPRWRR